MCRMIDNFTSDRGGVLVKGQKSRNFLNASTICMDVCAFFDRFSIGCDIHTCCMSFICLLTNNNKNLCNNYNYYNESSIDSLLKFASSKPIIDLFGSGLLNSKNSHI